MPPRYFLQFMNIFTIQSSESLYILSLQIGLQDVIFYENLKLGSYLRTNSDDLDLNNLFQSHHYFEEFLFIHSNMLQF
jgi:hypothetical protein